MTRLPSLQRGYGGISLIYAHKAMDGNLDVCKNTVVTVRNKRTNEKKKKTNGKRIWTVFDASKISCQDIYGLNTFERHINNL